MTKILILGSNGFLGRRAVRYYEEKKSWDVWGADISVRTGEHPNRMQLPSDPAQYGEMFGSEVFDVCINCTGAANVSLSVANPVLDFQLNTFNVICLLESIRVSSPQTRFLNLSSAAVYGNPIRLPVGESDRLAPVSPYGYHKRIAEEILEEYHSVFGLRTASARVFSAYGPGLRKQIIWDLYQKAQFDEEVRLSGTGLETRDFLYVDDVIRALDIIVQKADFSADVFNVGSGIETSISDIAHRVLEGLGSRKAIRFDGVVRAGDPLHWRADTGRIASLGFSPQTTIDAGIEACCRWMLQTKLDD